MKQQQKEKSLDYKQLTIYFLNFLGGTHPLRICVREIPAELLCCSIHKVSHIPGQYYYHGDKLGKVSTRTLSLRN